MIISVRHVVHFRYSAPVFCEPLTLRLQPRSDFAQSLLSYHLSVDPLPAGRSELMELEGHPATRLWFHGLISTLTIKSQFEAKTRLNNPFNFLLEAQACRLPFTYESVPPRIADWFEKKTISATVQEFSEQVAWEADYQTIPFLTLLAKRISERFDYHVRPQGAARSADATLELGAGACRDLAVLFNEAARAQGLVARFVSGYCAAETIQDQAHLHAWSEVYLPGAGWRGFDPSQGVMVGSHHIALAASLEPAGAAPTEGSFRGPEGTSSVMEGPIEITTYRDDLELLAPLLPPQAS